MELSRKCYICCMQDNTYSNYVCFKNITDTPNVNNNNFILNKIPGFHITSPLKLCDDIFESLPKSFDVKIIIEWMKSHVKIVTKLSQVNV